MPNEHAPDGIWPHYEVFYIEGLLYCSSSALKSVSDLFASLQRGSKHSPSSKEWITAAETILSCAQNLAIQGAAMSRYFWPARKGDPQASRARRLREGLGVPNDSPLRDRRLRNTMEHLDEHLDRFCATTIVGHILPTYVGPITEGAEVPSHCFRAYYTDQGVFEVLGHRFEMQPIADAISDVHGQLLNCVHNGGRIPYPPSSDQQP